MIKKISFIGILFACLISRISSFHIKFPHLIYKLFQIKIQNHTKKLCWFWHFFGTHLLIFCLGGIGKSGIFSFLTKKKFYVGLQISLIPINCKLIRGLRLRLAAVLYHSRQFSSAVDRLKEVQAKMTV